MEQRLDLTQGHITKTLVKLALPIVGTSCIQMAYNMIDMIFIGRVGAHAVAAVGTAGFYTWLALAFIMISKIGAEIKVAQEMGAKNLNQTRSVIVSALQINLVLAIIYGACGFFFRDQIIGFFNITDQVVIDESITYLVVMALSMVFYFINPVFTGIFNGSGDSKTPFIINTIGLVFNIVFDPLLIFGFGPIKGYGVLGAALATSMAQVLVTICFIFVLMRNQSNYLKFNILSRPNLSMISSIFKLGLPAAVQSGLFTFFSMVIGRIVAGYGAVPIAVQKVGSQIEAISWMTAGGFSTALGAFVGQNYGGHHYDRIEKGFYATIRLAAVLGVFATLLLVFFGKPIFAIFLPEAEAIAQGDVYLKILGLSQLFMCLEITTQGLFNGLGRTYIPSVVSIVFTGARIPIAYYLSQPHLLGINGIWWSITITTIIKGILMILIYIVLTKRQSLYLKVEDDVASELSNA